MVKKLKQFKNIPLLALTISNIAMVIRYGINLLTAISVILAVVVFVLDLIEVFKHD